jgi:tripartite-type tricarboxylate transporter receptor subunit TctC
MKIAALLACACFGAASVAAAQKFVVAAPAGSGADVVARAIAAKMGATVENGVPDTVAKAAPDGSTLLLATPTLTAAIALQPNLPFDGLKAFAPVARVASEPCSSSRPRRFPRRRCSTSSRWRKRTRADQLCVGRPRQRVASRIRAPQVGRDDHARARGHEVRRRGHRGGRRGQREGGVRAVRRRRCAAQGGKIKALAVTGPARLPLLPDVPTMRESGLLDYEFNAWLGVLAPATASKATVDRINEALRKAVQSPDLRDRLSAMLGTEPRVSTPEEFAAQLRREVTTFEKVGRELNFKLE